MALDFRLIGSGVEERRAVNDGFKVVYVTAFQISETPIDATSLARRLASAQAGACVTFEGWVRDHNEGRAVQRLDYQAYAPLAQSEGERILDEAREKFAILEARCVH